MPAPDAEIEALYEELLLQVELVQMEQLALLRCLVRHHGLRQIHAEGLTKKDLPALQTKITALQQIEKQVPTLKAQLEEVHQLQKEMGAKDRENTERHQQASKIEKEIVGLREQHRLNLLEIGVAGRLLVSGEIEELLPLDDDELLERAKPIRLDGRVE